MPNTTTNTDAIEKAMHDEYGIHGKSDRYLELREQLLHQATCTPAPARTKIRSKRMQAVDRAMRLIDTLEENCSDAAKDGNEILHDDLAVILSALYAADIPTKEGYLRIELQLADLPGQQRQRRDGFLATRRPR